MTLSINPDNLFNNYAQWNINAASGILQANTMEELSAASEQAGLFDFQQGNDYYPSLHALATGEMKATDKDGNGLIDFEEFFDKSIENYRGILPSDKIEQLEAEKAILNKFLDDTMTQEEWDSLSNEGLSLLCQFIATDYDGDNQHSVDELELLYSMADESLPSEANERVRDGKFSQEDLAQASETLLNMLIDENPKLEEELSSRNGELDKLAREYKKSEFKKMKSYDIDKDGEVQQAEFMIAMEKQNGNSPEAKAAAYCIWQLMNSIIGDNSDERNSLDATDMGMYIEHQFMSGFDGNGYYNYLLENFIPEDAPNHKYYQQVLEAYQNAATK